MKLTETDEYVLSMLPDGWFRPEDLPWHIRRPAYRLKRLHELGKLKRRLNWAGLLTNPDPEYHVI